MKIFTTRDGATAYLRKNGVAKENYNEFITKLTDGNYAIEDIPTATPEVENTSTDTPRVRVRAPRDSAARMFQELIMQGELTDSEIFLTVQTKFGLDDSKTKYVSWYRNHLKKAGKNPPARKGEERAKKRKTTRYP